MSSREQILERLKTTPWANPNLPMALVKSASFANGDIDLFISKVQLMGAQAERVSNLEAAQTLISQIIKEQGVSNVIGAADSVTASLQLEELAVQDGFSYQTCMQLEGLEYRQYVTAAQLGISGCAYGVAETGTLVLSHCHSNERLVSHAPDHYIGIIFSKQILADRFALASLLQSETNAPAAWTLVTGVSRTADVGMQVVLGMHGPRRVTVIIID